MAKPGVAEVEVAGTEIVRAGEPDTETSVEDLRAAEEETEREAAEKEVAEEGV
ncbi:uncharacterized protein BDCG_17642 [Blastomyces dermatitidis ER-3]|uniref:Uncharacterized protein n=1 Tax=Ajellomyces dermatitidis (strain ER-3 / ATCC MYA-2586) TaxID=559297 RepID=A0ABX2VZK8_AJEDR|nr:uncharacterized protein BDCG_17642 [Blastomyces dermatitidis ER-3]OAT02571.1 hypothetical protein BDCG_17642 [Blastomyces dermatitidis ER-3]